jgi:hypothetical protein
VCQSHARFAEYVNGFPRCYEWALKQELPPLHGRVVYAPQR